VNRFYTASGDDGFTGLLRDGRIPKYDTLLEVIGTLDEANAALGVARSVCKLDLSRTLIMTAQRDLYHLMAEVAAAPENAESFRRIDPQKVTWLETQIRLINTEVQAPKDFIVPGDSLASAAIDLARTVVRRAERRIAALVHEGVLENHELLRYLNRLSSLCFALELLETQSISDNGPTYARLNK
jgi:cob(I)alamin adenosyltransferase